MQGIKTSLKRYFQNFSAQARSKKLFQFTLVALFSLFLVIFLANWRISSKAEGKCFSSVDKIEKRKVGLVLGCAPQLSNGLTNAFFLYRMQAAARLFHAGKVRFLLVSGDNHHKSYDEVSAMKEALVQLKVPAEKVFCDYAGFRTHDSIIRAKEVFQEEKITIISQKFHNERALMIAESQNIDAIAYNAADVLAVGGLKTSLREKLARVKTFIDLSFGKKSKFLGNKISIK